MSTSKQKGAAFERLVSKKIYELTGIQTKRNLEQVRDGGLGDLTGVPGWTIECKYRSSPGLPDPAWWRQVCKAAQQETCSPVLIFRTGRSPIMAMFRLRMSGASETASGQAFQVMTSLEDWVALAGLDPQATSRRG